MTLDQLIEKLEKGYDWTPKSTARNMLRIFLKAVDDGEVVDGYEISFGLKPEFAKFLAERESSI